MLSSNHNFAAFIGLPGATRNLEFVLTVDSFDIVSLKRLDREVSNFGSESSEPILIHLVTNGVIGDSRVIKSAQTSRDLGIRTAIVGFGPKAMVGTAQGIPVFIAPRTRQIANAAQNLAARTSINPDSAGLEDWLIERHSSAMLQKDLQQHSWLKATVDGRKLAGKRFANKRKHKQDQNSTFRPTMWWLTKSTPAIAASRAILPLLNKLQPAAIHAHDIIPLQIAAFFSGTQKLKRRPFKFLYDAHEYVTGLAEADPDIWEPYLEIERNYIDLATAVITVSDTIADHLVATYGLSSRPKVVANSPTLESAAAPSLRQILGLPNDSPIMVHSGWIDRKRGVDTAVASLVHLPKVHLALVVGNPVQADDAVSFAHKIGVSDRVHIAGYVAPEQISNYLREVNIGLIPRKDHPNHRVSLPTKFREYLMARVPLVVSDVGELSTAKDLGVGETFEPDDPLGLAHAVNLILDDPGQYQENITNDLLWTMSWESSVSALATTYSFLLNQKLPDLESIKLSTLEKGEEKTTANTANLAQQTDSLTRFGTALTIGPYNNAGQASNWNLAVSRKYNIPTSTLAYRDKYGYSIDIPIKRTPGVPRDLDRRIRHIRLNTSHLLIDSFEVLLAGTLLFDPLAEAEFFRSMNKQLAYVAHGSDIRTPSIHRDSFEFSFFNETPEDWNNRFELSTLRRQEIAQELNAPLFVSTPDLKLYLPTAKWLPLAIDIDRWQTEREAMAQNKPRVLHLPSRSEPPIKGTEHIDRVMNELHRKGLIEYSRPNQCTNKEMNRHIREADIVVDQILTGSYGVTAVEAMAAGRLVIGNVGTATRSFLTDQPPIIDANPTNLAEVMVNILDERSSMREVAQQGISYAARWHSGEKSAMALQEFLFG